MSNSQCVVPGDVQKRIATDRGGMGAEVFGALHVYPTVYNRMLR